MSLVCDQIAASIKEAVNLLKIDKRLNLFGSSASSGRRRQCTFRSLLVDWELAIWKFHRLSCSAMSAPAQVTPGWVCLSSNKFGCLQTLKFKVNFLRLKSFGDWVWEEDADKRTGSRHLMGREQSPCIRRTVELNPDKFSWIQLNSNLKEIWVK